MPTLLSMQISSYELPSRYLLVHISKRLQSSSLCRLGRYLLPIPNFATLQIQFNRFVTFVILIYYIKSGLKGMLLFHDFSYWSLILYVRPRKIRYAMYNVVFNFVLITYYQSVHPWEKTPEVKKLNPSWSISM